VIVIWITALFRCAVALFAFDWITAFAKGPLIRSEDVFVIFAKSRES